MNQYNNKKKEIIKDKQEQTDQKFNRKTMSRILIGSSNVNRFYSPEKFKDYKSYTMVKCCNKETYKARMECLDPKEIFVIISVVENILADAVRGTSDEKFDSIVCETMKDFFVTLKKAAEKMPGTKFAMVKPILRPSLPWYMENFDKISEFYEVGITSLKLTNVTKLDCVSRMAQQFDSDGVHLTATAGKMFVEAILMTAEAFFNAENIDLTNDVDMGTVEGASGSAVGSHAKARQAQALENRLISLEAEVRDRKEIDNLMMARVREELDMATNTKKEDRIVITGLTSKTPKPDGFEERKKWIRDIVDELLNRIVPGSSEKIVFINQGRNLGKDIPMAEVKIDSREHALKIRNTFVAKKKAGEDFGRIHIANSVSLATRVRVDILRAFAKQFGVEGVEEMYVMAYISRPILHIRDVSGSRMLTTLTFADAVTRFRKMVKEEFLGEAYRRAGNSFKGQLEQHFVVLKEDGTQYRYQQGDEQESRQRKRPYEGTGANAQSGAFMGTAEGRGRGKGLGWERGKGRGARGSGGSKSARMGF